MDIYNKKCSLCRRNLHKGLFKKMKNGKISKCCDKCRDKAMQRKKRIEGDLIYKFL